MSQVTRRTLGLMLAGGSLSGCATANVLSTEPRYSEPFERGLPLRLAPVHVAEDRVIRSIAGLRPFRSGGFVVRGAKLGDKLVVHNYGHGGGGITLSWGTSHLALDQGFVGPERDYAVLGCGAVGLATARLIQRRGGRVTIYAKALPPDTTSNIAGGQWWPASVHDTAATTPAYLDQYVRAARLAYREYQTLTGPQYGVRWVRNYYVGDQQTPERVIGPLGDVAPEARMLQPGDHPFGPQRALQVDHMQVEPAIYLQAMLEDVLTAGGKVVVRDLKTPADVARLPEPVVFNCTGLGARDLFGDPDLIPIRGQLVVLLPQPEVTYNLVSSLGYMFPRSDGIILGGTFDRNVWETEPQPDITARILANHKQLFAPLTAPA